jgi:hypothetical protein
MDESFDMRNQGVFVVGGILGRGVATFELERRWEQLRKRTDIDIQYFKASECERGRGEFRKFVADPKNITPAERAKLDSISHEFLNLVVHPVAFDDRSYICVHGIGVVQQDFYEVIQDANARAVLGDSPYRLAYDLAMIQCAWAMKALQAEIRTDKQRIMSTSSSKECVCFCCDKHEKHGPLASSHYHSLKESNPIAAEYMATFCMDDEKQYDSLQAADAAAFEVRRALNLSLGQWKGILRKQFNLIADAKAMFLITHTVKSQLLHIIHTHKPGEAFKLDALMELQLDENIRITI